MSEKNEKNFQYDVPSATPFAERLKSACDGLYYISETDATIVPFAGPSVSKFSVETILQQASGRANAAPHESDFDGFFEKLTMIKDWYGEREKERAARFAALRDLLKQELVGPKVYRVGATQIDMYIVGTDAEGNLAGVSTKAVET